MFRMICLCLFLSFCIIACRHQSSRGEESNHHVPSEKERSSRADTGGIVPDHVSAESPSVEHSPFDETRLSGHWAKYRAIDIHAHIGTFRGYDLSLGTLMANVQSYGVDLALISNIDGAALPGVTLDLDEIKANRATVEAVKTYPHRLRGIAWTRPGKGSPKNIEPFLKMTMPGDTSKKLFVALKFHPNMNQFAADKSDLDGYMRLCEKYKLPAVFHAGGANENADAMKIYKLAKRFPKVHVVLYHLGFGGAHDYVISTIKQSIDNKDATLYTGTAQATPEAVLKAVRVLGSQKVLFGTDASYYGKGHYARYKNMVEAMSKSLTPQQFSQVMRENAKKLFSL